MSVVDRVIPETVFPRSGVVMPGYRLDHGSRLAGKLRALATSVRAALEQNPHSLNKA
jgi:hypothetical protein